ncbi:MAG: hypothetical protein KAT16_10120, partial [Candidatus Heimdallarchaeota archaeon]|nr:hypothetical protein [Candidatus Heimdallarchaeota archaeon]
ESQESQEEEKVEEAKAETPVEESQKEEVKVEEAKTETPVEESQEEEKVEEAKTETPVEESQKEEKVEEAKTEEEPLNVMKISELSPFDRKLQVVFVVTEKGESRSIVSRKTNEEHNLADITVGDDSGIVTCTLWDETIDRVSEGSTYVLKNGYVNVFQGQMRLALGKFGSIEDTEEVIELDSVNKENDRSKEQHEDRRRPSYNRGGGGGGDRGSYGGGDRSRKPRGRGDTGGYRGRPSNQDRW